MNSDEKYKQQKDFERHQRTLEMKDLTAILNKLQSKGKLSQTFNELFKEREAVQNAINRLEEESRFPTPEQLVYETAQSKLRPEFDHKKIDLQKLEEIRRVDESIGPKEPFSANLNFIGIFNLILVLVAVIIFHLNFTVIDIWLTSIFGVEGSLVSDEPLSQGILIAISSIMWVIGSFFSIIVKQHDVLNMDVVCEEYETVRRLILSVVLSFYCIVWF